MKHKITKKKDVVEIEIIFDKTTWTREIDVAYSALAPKYKVQGFRAGKAPKGVIEKAYGKGLFEEEAIKTAFTREYNKILEANAELKPIDYPTVKNMDEQADGGMKVLAEVFVEPEFTLGTYKGLEVKKKEIKVTDKDVDAFLDHQASMRVKSVAAAKGHKIAMGDVAVIDFVGSVDGKEFEGGKAEKFELEIGSKQFIDTFEEQLVGLVVGDKKDVNVKFPTEYHAKELAGKMSLFKVTVRNILLKQKPAIDDTFAKESSEFNNLADWKKQIRENLQKSAEAKAEQETNFELIEKVTSNTKVEVPQIMVDMQIDFILQDINARLMQQGVGLEQYAQMTGTTIEKMREEQFENAKRSVKARLVFDAIAKKEGITITEADIDAEIKRVCGSEKKRYDDIRKKPNVTSMVEQNLKFEKITNYLKANNKIV